MPTNQTSKPDTCQRCQNQRVIPREPGAKLRDDRPDIIVCPRCGGSGPVSEIDRIEAEIIASDRAETEDDPTPRPPGVPFTRSDIQERWDRGERWDDEDAEYERSLSKPPCFEPRGLLKHEMVAELDAIQQRTIEMLCGAEVGR